jgi:hypothetical protein
MSGAAFSSSLRSVTLLEQRDGNSLDQSDTQLSLPLRLAFRPTQLLPASLQQNEAKSMERVSGKSAKTFGELPVDRMGELEVAQVIAAALAHDYGDFKFTDKLIAKDSGASPRTANNWRSEMNTPSLPYFLRLYARSPAVRAAVRKLTAMEADLDPDAERARSRLVQAQLGNP